MKKFSWKRIWPLADMIDHVGGGGMGWNIHHFSICLILSGLECRFFQGSGRNLSKPETALSHVKCNLHYWTVGLASYIRTVFICKETFKKGHGRTTFLMDPSSQDTDINLSTKADKGSLALCDRKHFYFCKGKPIIAWNFTNIIQLLLWLFWWIFPF